MPRPKGSFKTPTLTLHKPSGRARVCIDGKDRYCGDYGTAEAQQQYDRLIAEWILGGRQPAPEAATEAARGLTVSQVIAGFWEHAKSHYPRLRSPRRKDRRRVGQLPPGAAAASQAVLRHIEFRSLVGHGSSFQSRLHFFNAAALAMRRILVNYAYQRGTLKRGANYSRIELSDLDVADRSSADPMDWLELDEALKQLAVASPRQHQVVMLRFFSGRTEAEISQMLEISESTVRRDWATARVWLCWAMQHQE